ncbi:MAG: hemolysin D [Flavobacteriia bacterium]|nr:MAG: hemolysin D [Flavobacteriia bacterium]
MATTLYHIKEERINVISHLIGLILSVFAFIALLIKACRINQANYIAGFSIFGLSLIMLYLASTLYHSATHKETRLKLNIFDHASIYVLIAGSYTPYTLITLKGKTGWILFGVVWGIALIGVTYKIFFFGRHHDYISTVLYVLMGWLIVFVIKPLYNNLSTPGMIWLILGGVFYTVGALFYMRDKLNYNHAIFHIFVLLGSLCHFVSIYFFV